MRHSLLLPALLAVAVSAGKTWAEDTTPARTESPARSETTDIPPDPVVAEGAATRMADDGPQVIADSPAGPAGNPPEKTQEETSGTPDTSSETETAQAGEDNPSITPDEPPTVTEAPAVIELPEDESVEDITASDTDLQRNEPDNEEANSPSATDDSPDIAAEEAPVNDSGTASIEVIPETQPAQAQPFRLLSGEVLPGTTARLGWSPGIQIAGLSKPTPVLVVNGNKPGPALCMTGAVHGDELNGIEIIRRVIYDLDPAELSGTVVGIPIVNLQGFQQGSRYLADRRDLNRYFPGSEDGSLAHRIAHSLFEQVILNCDMLVDIHTGSLKRTNLPQLRADMDNPKVAELTKGFDAMVVVHSSGGAGMLRTAATEAGVPTVTMEVGESMRIQEDHISAGVNSLVSLMEKQGMTARLFQWGDPEPVYYQSHWIRANQGGILFSDVELGAYVTEGTILGTVSDPITNEQSHIRADADGRVIGMAVDQVVMAGFAAYHLGSRADTEESAE
ncbi:succinylglutamate desuccinylase/aspartoacylase family protein [Marinobacter sp. M1N3S26]|uniref:succinylglutamate desuccinylase/aspartoacylase family protein n=1 Tax=Marinobacter sp. M1N3S26 TaxID=3382299 RepID=UPI00387B4552